MDGCYGQKAADMPYADIHAEKIQRTGEQPFLRQQLFAAQACGGRAMAKHFAELAPARLGKIAAGGAVHLFQLCAAAQQRSRITGGHGL
jgi:hypothetical protein